MSAKQGEVDIKFIILIALFVLLAVLAGKGIAQLPPLIPVIAALGIVIAIITFVNTDLGLMVLIFSMLLSPELKIAEVPARAVVVRVDDILIMAVFFTWLAKMAINKELGLLKSTPLNRPIAIYILVCILFTSRVILTGQVHALQSSFYILKYIEYFMLYFMFANTVRSKKQVQTFILVFLITCALVLIYAYVQIGQGAYRITAPFEGEHGEPNTLGGYLLLLMAVMMGLLLYTTSTQRRFLLGGLLCLTIIPFLYTLSRGSYLGFIPMYLTLIILTRKKKLLLVGLLVLAIILSPFILPRQVKARIISTFVPGKVYEVLGAEVALEPSAVARVETWKKIVTKRWAQSPFVGLGITGVGLVDSQYFRVLGELGIIGLGVFIWLLVTIFRSGLQVLRTTADEFAQGLTLGFLAGFIGISVLAITANAFIIVRIMEPFWFLAAIVIMLPRIMAEEEHLPSEVKI
ncbi:hypothetical protein KAT51_05205 [bacterium]|nr:hypothetical protein [bacterium]